ncbi:putative virion core protein (lumpy skin disease virus) [Schinkia azotoformans MEV2011]|uniref:Putative virion core protein (Lumpy skin disease virus) n=1 Tax=Schinkia azotoformans MEV2011 TaxID=1348973 RepID=A0A072NUW6_SCHAZ|nr:SPFH domain-containing protein [Schinkia azotoformans]KEF37045.1 putative virion core protein (lumpy skin disease virus) [Schinkia azotoformans MEV2011]MEC1694360.1 SPFH domain-containing protein [Schinkia azotoformans]MEC1723172.1 SPFH domain-containing protein [Schinkia azotoformans]MEC1772100.1 SPFH domain-containing protein [Schinkia azotoformans]MEC1779207.1 SPFH domain-containing protein [Schinkia azotoformans]
MGIIKATLDAVRGGFADQWLEVIEPQAMSDTTVMSVGVKVRAKDKRNSNFKGTDTTISNGSIIHVNPNQFMMLVDGGRIIDYTAEEGYYKVENSAMPSLFNGEFGEALHETFNRIKFGGVPSSSQKVYFINLQEIKGIKFGTRNPINYFDNFYNAELFLRTHGTYSIKIVEPLKFFVEAIPRNKSIVDINEINEQYLSEFMNALQTAINQMSSNGIRISFVPSKGMELAKYMSTILDEDWTRMRGMQVESVGINSISYDEQSQKLINMRNQGAMLQDPTIREGFVQGAIARGLEAAGSNESGAMQGFLGVGMGMQGAGGFMGAASEANRYQMQQQAQQNLQKQQPVSAPSEQWKCKCGHSNTGRFCSECGSPKQTPEQETWNCQCGHQNHGKFCANCGMKRPEEENKLKCKNCGFTSSSNETVKFCPECGNKF